MRFWFTMFALLILDRSSKLWILHNYQVGESSVLIPGILNLTHTQNVGAAFSLMEGKVWLFILIAIGVSAAAIIYYMMHKVPRMEAYALGLIVGGALGNVIDRIAYGAVVDFFSMGWWPVFNVADMGIVTGGILLVISVFLNDKDDRGTGFR